MGWRMRGVEGGAVASRHLGDWMRGMRCLSCGASMSGEITMHAWICDNPIGPEALTWKELPTPEPKAGEVRVAIRAASLNFPDLLIVQNKYQMKPPLPFVPGSEYAGTVEAVGEGVEHLKVGEAVAAFGGTGGFATHAVVDA